MSGVVNVIDVAATTYEHECEGKVKLATVFEEADIDLSGSDDVTIRVNGKKIDTDELDDFEVGPGDVVLITRNIEGGRS